MRTNGFAYFRGEGAPAQARDAARRVRRYAQRVLVSTGGEFTDIHGARLSGMKEVALAYALERDGGFPLFHGCAGGPSSREGEFSLLGKGKDGVYGARDALGARGLWAVRSGPGAGSIASDYRLLGGAALVPPGMVYAKGGMRSDYEDHGEGVGHPSFQEAARALASLVDESVRGRVQGQGRVAVSFSGGLDSSLLALLASRYTDVVLCSAYAPGSRDEGQSKRAAELLGLELEARALDQGAVAKGSLGAELPPGDATAMDLALWCIYSTTSELAKRRKARTILLGQLADELFGGYMKYAIKAREEGEAAAEAMMRQDVKGCAERGFLRDEAACSASCEVRFPYADERVASFASRLPLDYKIREGERKAVLRAAALELGLHEELASAPKKAAQFSSGVAKLLRRQ